MSDVERRSDNDRLERMMAGAQAGDGEAYTALLEAVAPRVRQAVR